MKILMLVNWKVRFCERKPNNLQPPDYFCKNDEYWFFRYFKDKPDVDVIDVSSFSALEKFEKNELHFYVLQAIKAIPKLNKYDLIVSHGMQSAVVICFWRRFFKTKSKHIVFDIGSFASASEDGNSLRLMQFASKSIDGIIFHMKQQKLYYKKFFPWVVDKSRFIRYGADFDFFNIKKKPKSLNKKYIVCAGKNKCDWNTVVEAFKLCDLDLELHLIGGKEKKYENIDGVLQFSYLPINTFIDQVANAEFCILPLEPVNFSFGQMRLLQQMALKKCVIVSDVPSILDYVEDGGTALVYKRHDVKDLLRCIKTVCENNFVKERIQKQAYDFVNIECNEKIMAERIEDYFNDIFEGRC